MLLFSSTVDKGVKETPNIVRVEDLRILRSAGELIQLVVRVSVDLAQRLIDPQHLTLVVITNSMQHQTIT